MEAIRASKKSALGASKFAALRAMHFPFRDPCDGARGSKWIQQGQDGDAEALFGPSVEVMVQAMEEDEAGQEVLLEIEIPCLLLQPIDSASFETFRSGDRRRCSVSWKALLICCL